MSKSNQTKLVLALIFFGVITSYVFKATKREKKKRILPYDDFDGNYSNLTDDEQVELIKGYGIPDVEEGAGAPELTYGEVEAPKSTKSAVGDIINFTINNTTDGDMPLVSVVGNDQDPMDTANATTQYRWNFTNLLITTENTVSVQYKAVGEASFSTKSALFLQNSLNGIIAALNTLNLGQFFPTTSGLITYVNNYNNNVVFGDITTSLVGGTIINTQFNQGTGYSGSYVWSVFVLSGGIVVLAVSGNGGYNGNASTLSSGMFALNTDGTLNTTYPLNTISEFGDVTDSIIAPNGKLFYIGNYNFPNGYGIVSFNPDGTYNTTFNAGIASNPFSNGIPNSISAQSDSKVIIGGDFLGGINPYLLRLNTVGTFDSSFTPTLDNNVTAVAVQSDDKILISGGFTIVNGNPTSTQFLRLNADGTTDGTFNAYTNFGQSLSIIIQPDLKILFFNGGFVRRINSDGSNDTSFTPYNTATSNSILALQEDGKIIVGNAGGVNSLLRLNANGTLDTSWVIPILPTIGTITKLAIYGNTVYVSAETNGAYLGIFCYNLTY
jgi:uncharacterized delta-60 repeat protein